MSRCNCGFLDKACELGLLIERGGELLVASLEVEQPRLVTVCPGCEWRREYLAVSREPWATGGTCHFCADLVFPSTERVFVSQEANIFICLKCVRFFSAQAQAANGPAPVCDCGFLARSIEHGLIEVSQSSRLSVPHKERWGDQDLIISHPVTVCPGCDWRRERDIVITPSAARDGAPCQFCAKSWDLEIDRVFASRSANMFICLPCVEAFDKESGGVGLMLQND